MNVEEVHREIRRVVDDTGAKRARWGFTMALYDLIGPANVRTFVFEDDGNTVLGLRNRGLLVIDITEEKQHRCLTHVLPSAAVEVEIERRHRWFLGPSMTGTEYVAKAHITAHREYTVTSTDTDEECNHTWVRALAVTAGKDPEFPSGSTEPYFASV